MKKEPSHFRYRKPPPSSSSSSLQSKKVKLCCSYNGTFQPKPPSGKLRYIGGETRIVSIDRNISFMQIVYRISQLCPTILTTCFCIKYQLPESNNEDDTPLVSITTDEDVKCMIEEYDHGNHATRLWVFVCTKATSAANADDDRNWYVRPLQDSCFMNFCDLGLGNSCLESKIANAHIVGIPNCEDLQRKVVFKNQELVNNAVRYGKFHDLISLEAIEPKTMFINEYGIKNSCSPLKESAYIPQIQTSEVESYGFEASELKSMYTSDNVAQNSYSPFEESANLSHMKTSRMNGDQSLVDLYGQNMSDYNAPISHFPESRGGVVQFNNGGELGVGANFPVRLTNEIVKEGLVDYEDGGNAGISNQSLAAMQLANEVNNISVGSMSRGSNVNPGWRNTEGVHTGHSNNISLMYSTVLCDSVQRSPDFDSCVSQLAGRVSPMKPAVCGNRALSNLHLRFRNHRTVGTDIRNQRNSSYPIRNHRNSRPEIGSYHSIGIDGKTCSAKSYHGLRPSSNIFKQGQAKRSNYMCLRKARSSVQDNAWEGMFNMVESSNLTRHSINLNHVNGALPKRSEHQTDGRCASDVLSRQSDHLHADYKNSSPHINHLRYQSTAYTSPLPCNFVENQPAGFRAPSTQEDLSNFENHADCGKVVVTKRVRGARDASCYVPVNGRSISIDLNRDPIFFTTNKSVEIPGLYNGACYSVDNKVQFDQNVLLDTKGAAKSSSHDQKGAGTECGVVSSLVDLSLYKLSLSSSKGARPSISSLASNGIYESSPVCEVGPRPNPLDFMDEGCFSSGPLVENASGGTSKFSDENAVVLKKNLSQFKDNNQAAPSSLAMDERGETNGSCTSPNVTAGISSELVGFYTHLATRELQTIKHSDLEDIREIGSGTYGTVFYGKWKGSDVAIKRIKPTCFSGSELEKDRLIADFWKEAHILGQLHHPNVVAFYGVVKDGPVTNLATVTEYMVNGSLKQVLQRKDRTIDRRKRILIAMDAAFGMEYLHEKHIVHFDLKSHNFLVNMRDPQRPVCKIGDMGLSKVKQKTLISGGVRGTLSWMAPELLTCEKSMVTEKVDIYSFGIVMWELLTGEEPYALLRPEETIAGIIKGDLRPEIPSWCDPVWRSLMERCWSSDPGSRPSFSIIAKELRAMAAALNTK